MFTIVIKLEPAQEVIRTYTSSLNLSIIPIHNCRLTGALPGSLTPGFTEAYLTTSEISWCTQGISIWAEVEENDHASFDLELYNSDLISAGLKLGVSILTGEIQPESLYFPPGSLSTRGVRLHINIGDFIRRATAARERSPQLFQQQYQQHLQNTLAQQNHQPLSRGQRASSNFIQGPHNFRRIEQQLNRDRGEHLKNSSLF